MISMYEKAEDELIEALRGTDEVPANLALMGVTVLPLPEYKAQFSAVDQKMKARVYVSFGMQRYGTEKEPTEMVIDNRSQDSSVYFTLSISSRSKRGETGLLMILELASRLVSGLPFSYGGNFSLFSADLLIFDNNTWHYQIFVRLREFPMLPIKNWYVETPLSDVLLQIADVEQEDCLEDIQAGWGDDEQGEDFDINGSILAKQI